MSLRLLGISSGFNIFVAGTFTAEKKSEKVAYGLVHPLNSFNPIYVQVRHVSFKARTTTVFKREDGGVILFTVFYPFKDSFSTVVKCMEFVPNLQFKNNQKNMKSTCTFKRYFIGSKVATKSARYVVMCRIARCVL